MTRKGISYGTGRHAESTDAQVPRARTAGSGTQGTSKAPASLSEKPTDNLTLEEWRAAALRNATQARFWKSLALQASQQLQAARNTPETHTDKRIRYQDRTGDTAAARADRKRK